MKKREIRCIIAGFDPFGVAAFNPSEEIVKLFPDLITAKGFGKVDVEKVFLPTCCTESWKKLKKSLNKFAKDDLVVVVMGLAETRNRLSLERVALNLRDYRIKDNNGHQYPAAKIHPLDENALFTTIAVDEIKDVLIKKGIPCEVSNHAGTFVCNEIYFRALRYQTKHQNLRAALFIHVPPPNNFAIAIKASKRNPDLKTFEDHGHPRRKAQQLSMMQEAVEVVLKECIKGIG